MRRPAFIGFSLCGVALCCSSISCVSVAVLDRWKASGSPSTVKLDATGRSADEVQLRWSARSELPYSPERVFAFDPGLDGCSQVSVLARSSDEVFLAEPVDLVLTGFGRDVSEASAESWAEIGDARCTVMLVVGSLEGQAAPRLHVSNSQDIVGTVKLETERNHWWLGLLPIGVAADAVGTAVLVPVWACMQPTPDNWCIVALFEGLKTL
jgi:hypothetical protein